MTLQSTVYMFQGLFVAPMQNVDVDSIGKMASIDLYFTPQCDNTDVTFVYCEVTG